MENLEKQEGCWVHIPIPMQERGAFFNGALGEPTTSVSEYTLQRTNNTLHLVAIELTQGR